MSAVKQMLDGFFVIIYNFSSYTFFVTALAVNVKRKGEENERILS